MLDTYLEKASFHYSVNDLGHSGFEAWQLEHFDTEALVIHICESECHGRAAKLVS
jgi:hypothetical protein